MTWQSPLKLTEILKSYDIPFVVIGGLAVNYHGYIRTTEDVDVVFVRSEESEKKLYTALHSVNACWISRDIDPKTNLERTVPVDLAYIRIHHIMMLCTDQGFLDIFDYIPGHPRENVQDLFKDCEEVDGVKFISLKWLRKLKQTTNRPKDLDDLNNLPQEC